MSESASLYDKVLRQAAALLFLRLTQAHCAAQCANQSTKQGSLVWLSVILNYQRRFSELSKLRISSATLHPVIHWVIYQIVKHKEGRLHAFCYF